MPKLIHLRLASSHLCQNPRSEMPDFPVAGTRRGFKSERRNRSPGMRFEIILNDLKCIVFEKYGILKIKSPIHMYQYETPVPCGSAILSLNLTQECILSLCPLYLTLLWTLLHCIYTESGLHPRHCQLFQALLRMKLILLCNVVIRSPAHSLNHLILKVKG